MVKYKKRYDAIILSSTFDEGIETLVKFIKNNCLCSEKVSESYFVKPVIVFENSESLKARKIQLLIEELELNIQPLVLINSEGKGFSSCLNFGISNTNSKFIMRIDTDDELNEQRLKEQLDEMISNNLDLCSGYMIDKNDNLLKYPSNKYEIALYCSLGTNPIAHPTTCIKRGILNIKYNEELERCEDFELWLNLFLTRDMKFKCLKYPLTRYSLNNSFKKDIENAKMQIRLRLKYSLKLIIAFVVLFLGIIPNLLRLIIKNNLLLRFRRKI